MVVTIKNNFFVYLFIVLYIHSYSQSNFEYERTWGTYLGPSGTQLTGLHYSKGILFDSQKNMHIRGRIWFDSSNSNAYYDQFLLGGGESFQGLISNILSTKITETGTPTFFGYHTSQSIAGYSLLEAIDSQDNKYFIIYGSSPSVQATANVFMPNDPIPSSQKKVLLAKYSPNGILLWATYLPFVNEGVQLTIDSYDNIYVLNRTLLTTNLTTNGVWQDNFDLHYNPQGEINPNYYLLKLNTNGQRIWATYMPCEVISMQYYDNSLYILAGANTNANLNTMATPGAYQTTPSNTSITKINANTGNREWGTYYGALLNTAISVPTDIAVNETGIYITGSDYDDSGLNFYGTPTSYKPTLTGGGDLFLSKFNHYGMREWSTYFGTSGSDMNEFDKPIVLNGNDIYISGNSYGTTNNIATPGSYQDAPESNFSNAINYYFAKFNSSGNLIWCSYYGGTSVYPGIVMPFNLAIKDNVLFLYGSTNSNTGFATEGAWMPQRNPSNTNQTTCFIARFDSKNLHTQESESIKNLNLYNNPNNGNFFISGKILTKEDCSLSLYDSAGRLIKNTSLSRSKKQSFNWQNLLTSGNYIVHVIKKNGEKIKTFKMTVKN